LTALAASHTLDMASTLDTLVYASCDDSGSFARIVLRGGGDMLLGAGQSDPNHVNGRAGLETLANKTAAALKKRGVKIVQFAVDDSLFGAKRYPEL
ncbi:D-alanyl-D-alanine carboxypeptidase, partial [Escherichia coli]|nr:D-alanyl-D-alanine carboxypeptidase [Escherichia coli]